MLEVRFGRLNITYDTRVIHFDLTLETIEQRIERLRRGREKDRETTPGHSQKILVR